MIYHATDLKAYFNEVTTQRKDGRWVPCRPFPFRTIRTVLKELWLVLRGKADVVVWDN